MSKRGFSLAIVGCGTMGEAFVRGLLRIEALPPARIIATTRRAEAATALVRRHKIRAHTDNLRAAREADVVLFALKPQTMRDVLDAEAMRAALAGKLVISIAAGVRLAQLVGWLPGSAVVRAMPNTPCLIGEGMTVLARGPKVGDAYMRTARQVFEPVGRVLELEDKHMDAVTSLNSSGPAFAYVILEALTDGGVMMGLRRDVATEIAAQMFQGAARMVLSGSGHPAALKDEVTTPAGCTIAGLLTMEDGRIRSVLARTIEEATRVAGRLGAPTHSAG